MTRLGLVVPAFRPDVARLEAFLRDLVETLEPAIVRVELDDPEAATLETLADVGLDPLEVNAVPYRRGKGAAVTAGFEALETEWLAFADDDASTAATELRRVVDALGEADLAVGSRRHPDAVVVGHRTFARRFMGDAFAWLARRLLEATLYDYQCGAKAITADAWAVVRDHLYQPGFAWDVELLAMAAALDLEVLEVPIRWEDRPGSTVSPVRSSLSMARGLLVARHRAEHLRASQLHDAFAHGEEPTALVDRESR